MANIKKIYEIEVIGEQQVIDKMKLVNAELDKARNAVKAMKDASKIGTLDTTQLDKERQKLIDLQTEAKKLRAELQAINNVKMQEKVSGESAAEKTRLALIERKNKVLAEASKQSSSSTEKTIVLQKTELGLYEQMVRKLNELKATARDIGLKKGVFSKEFLEASAAASNYSQQLEKVNTALANQHRVLSNKKEGLFGLNNSMAQVMREMPNFAIDPRIGIMSLTNNLPYLSEAIADVNKQAQIQKAEFQAWAANARKAAIETALKAGADQRAAIAAGAHAEAQVMLNYQAAKSPGIMKQIASSIFNWQTLLVVGISLVMLYNKEIIAWTQSLFKGRAAVDGLKKATAELGEAKKEANKNSAKELVDAEMLYRSMKDETLARKDRLEAAKDLQELYPKIFGNMTTEQMLVQNTADKYHILKDAIYASAMAEAVKAKITEAQIKFLEQEEKNLNKVGQAKIAVANAGKAGDTVFSGQGETADIYVSGEYRVDRAEKALDIARKARKADIDSHQAYLDRMYKIGQNYLAKAQVLDDPDKNPAAKKARASRLTAEQRDYLSDLLAAKDLELAKIKEAQQRGLINEEEYWDSYKNIVVKYRNLILDYLDGSNAAERKVTAQQRRKAIDEVARANDELFDFEKKAIDQEYKTRIKSAEILRDDVLNNLYSTNQEKDDAEAKFADDSYNNQAIYTQKMLDLNVLYNKSTLESTDLLLTELDKKRSAANLIDLTTAIKTLKNQGDDVQKGKDMLINQNEINAAISRTNVLKDESISNEDRLVQLQRISQELELANTNIELGGIVAEIALFDIQIEKRKLTNEELIKYNNLLREKAILEGKKAEAEGVLSVSGQSLKLPGSGASGIGSAITNSMKDSRGIISIGKDENGADIDGSAMIGEVIAQSFDMAQLAMNNYFEAERNQIERSKQLAYERIDLETAQMKRKSQSAAENESLDRQAAEKKKQADKEAGERMKKTKKQELRIALAMELANIGIAAAQNPLNGITLGAAGIAMYSVLAGLALARFAMNSAAINKATYGKGGKYGLGGKLSGPSHAQNNGMPVVNPYTGEAQAYMEGGEGIINKNSMGSNKVVSVTGTPNQIASRINAFGGGVDWAGGATLQSFATGGTYLGSNLQPPTFQSYFSSPSVSSEFATERLERIESSIENLAAITRSESMKKVVVSNKEIFGQRDEYIRQTEIATL